MEIEVSQDGEISTVALKGDLDYQATETARPRLREVLDRGGGRLIVDLREVNYADSTGLGLLVWLRQQVLQREGTLRLVVSRAPLRRMLELTGLAQLFDVYSGLEAARAGSEDG